MVRPIAILIVAAIVNVACRGPEQPPEVPAATDQPLSNAEVVEAWLHLTCGDGPEYDNLVAEIQKRAGDLENLFLEASRQGPPPAELERLTRSVEHTWSVIQRQLAAPATYGLREEDINRMRSMSLDGERQRALELLDHNYKAASSLALEIILATK